jgi:hypothetical protein
MKFRSSLLNRKAAFEKRAKALTQEWAIREDQEGVTTRATTILGKIGAIRLMCAAGTADKE